MKTLYQTKAELFAILADPIAVRLLDLVCDRDHELSSLLSVIGKPNAAEAAALLSRMRNVGLVELRRTGTEVVVTLNAPSIANVLAATRHVLRECSEHEDQPRLLDLEHTTIRV